MTNHHPHPRNDWDGGLFNGPGPGISIRMWLYGQIASALIISNPRVGPAAIAESATDYVDAILREYIDEKKTAAREDVGGRE